MSHVWYHGTTAVRYYGHATTTRARTWFRLKWFGYQNLVLGYQNCVACGLWPAWRLIIKDACEFSRMAFILSIEGLNRIHSKHFQADKRTFIVIKGLLTCMKDVHAHFVCWQSVQLYNYVGWRLR